MAQSTLTDTVRDPANNVVATSSGTPVNFRLMANGSPTPGFRVSDGVNVASLIVTSASTLGTISQALENNSNIVPTGTYYLAEILCPTSQGGTQEWALISSSSASPQSFKAALAAVIPSFTPITTVPTSVLAANNIWTGSNVFNGTPNTFVNLESNDPSLDIDIRARGAVGDGLTDNTTVIQTAMTDATSAGGWVLIPSDASGGIYLTDTLTPPANCRIRFQGGTLKLKAHATIKHPVIQIGSASAGCDRVVIVNPRIDGNAAAQTGPLDEFSPGIMLWGSNYCSIIGPGEIFDCQGDGVTIGYDTGRLVGSNGNTVQGLEIYSNARQGVAITYGDENRVLFNHISGSIDLEIDATIGECKNNLVHGNTGRTQTEVLGAPRISDLGISLATLNTDKTRTSGNIVSNNHCFSISGQYNTNTVFSSNEVVGSTTSQARLIDWAAVDNSVLADNTLVANSSVATGLTEIFRTRACSAIKVHDNVVANQTLNFHVFGSAFSTEAPAADQDFHNNTITGSGIYRSGAGANLSESALYKLEILAGSRTLTRLSGPPLSVSLGTSGFDLVITQSGGILWNVDFHPYCEIVSGSTATTFDQHLITKVVVSGSNRIVSLWASPVQAAPAYTQLAAASTTATLFFNVMS